MPAIMLRAIIIAADKENAVKNWYYFPQYCEVGARWQADWNPACAGYGINIAERHQQTVLFVFINHVH
jgi:hypothetical protein